MKITFLKFQMITFLHILKIPQYFISIILMSLTYFSGIVNVKSKVITLNCRNVSPHCSSFDVFVSIFIDALSWPLVERLCYMNSYIIITMYNNCFICVYLVINFVFSVTAADNHLVYLTTHVPGRDQFISAVYVSVRK